MVKIKFLIAASLCFSSLSYADLAKSPTDAMSVTVTGEDASTLSSAMHAAFPQAPQNASLQATYFACSDSSDSINPAGCALGNFPMIHTAPSALTPELSKILHDSKQIVLENPTPEALSNLQVKHVICTGPDCVITLSPTGGAN